MTDEQIMSGFKLFLRKQMSKLSFAEKLACADIIVLIDRQKAEIEELKEKHAKDERVLNDRIQESVNAVSEADQKYICTLERSIAAKDVKIERLLQKIATGKIRSNKRVCENVKHISIDLSKMFSGTLEKDLDENKVICPVCKGLGVVKRNNVFGIDGDTSEEAKKKLFPYNNQSLSPCPNCYNGVVELCRFCGRQIKRGYIGKCNCEEYKKQVAAKKKLKYQETINNAKKVNWDSVSEYVYDEKCDKFFTDEDEFVDYYWDLYQQEEHCYNNFDEYFENEIPKVLWCCEKSKIKLEAESIVADACEELHDDAYENIDDIDELQKYLDMWCDKQSGTTTYYPCYRMYVEVTKDLFLT